MAGRLSEIDSKEPHDKYRPSGGEEDGVNAELGIRLLTPLYVNML